MNIDIEKTIENFGYNPNTLRPNSCKIVIWKCASCLVIKEKKFVLAKRNKLCLNCSNKINANININLRSNKVKEWHKNNDHPLLGIGRPQSVIDAIRKANIGKHPSESSRKKMSESQRGDKNHFFGKKHTKESIEKMSIQQKKVAKRGKESHFYGKIYHPKKIKFERDGDIFFFKSSWELKVAEYLDSNSIIWEYESKMFEMVIDGNETTYTPDFYLPTTNTIIEVKGYWREDAIKKYNIFLEHQAGNFIIEIWDKKVLKEKNII